MLWNVCTVVGVHLRRTSVYDWRFTNSFWKIKNCRKFSTWDLCWSTLKWIRYFWLVVAIAVTDGKSRNPFVWYCRLRASLADKSKHSNCNIWFLLIVTSYLNQQGRLRKTRAILLTLQIIHRFPAMIPQKYPRFETFTVKYILAFIMPSCSSSLRIGIELKTAIWAKAPRRTLCWTYASETDLALWEILSKNSSLLTYQKSCEWNKKWNSLYCRLTTDPLNPWG